MDMVVCQLFPYHHACTLLLALTLCAAMYQDRLLQSNSCSLRGLGQPRVKRYRNAGDVPVWC